MKHYKDSQNNLYGFTPDQTVPPGLTEISDDEHQRLIAENQEKHNQRIVAGMPWNQQRMFSYPSIGDQLDALWKGGAALEEMRQRILDVKSKYPKT